MLVHLKSALIPSLLLVLLTKAFAAPPLKRQGMFGLCQGWGAGCSMDYRVQKNSKPVTGPKGKPTQPDTAYLPSYLFTSGSSWNPIGKKSALYTDIPFLRNPLFSLPGFKKPKGTGGWRYPMVYKNFKTGRIH